jgi:hypothetical protein
MLPFLSKLPDSEVVCLCLAALPIAAMILFSVLSTHSLGGPCSSPRGRLLRSPCPAAGLGQSPGVTGASWAHSLAQTVHSSYPERKASQHTLKINSKHQLPGAWLFTAAGRLILLGTKCLLCLSALLLTCEKWK